MSDLERISQSFGSCSALIVVDMSNGFTDPKSPLGGDYTDVITANQKLLAAFRKAKLPIFFTNVVYQTQSQARVFRDRIPALDILTPDSEWVKIDPRLGRQENEPVVEKQWASGFFKTELAKLLVAQNVDSLVVTGLTTSGCVRATAIDGLQHDYKVFIPREAVSDRNEAAHAASLFDLHAKYADVVDVEYILKRIEL